MTQEISNTDEQQKEPQQEQEHVEVEEKPVGTDENPLSEQNETEEEKPIEQVVQGKSELLVNIFIQSCVSSIDNETKSQLDEIRKLIQSYVKDELKKSQRTIQPTPPSLPPPTEKRPSTKSSASKTPKPPK